MSGRSILVTAGASGIGRAIAELFHARGDRVIVCDVDQAALDSIAAALPGIVTSRTDVADPAAVAAMIDRVGPISVLINNAGVAGPIGGI
ncbi:MAG: SDR family NAD(P)-dependent oxidoreductase, partial [Sphingobium sp.]